MASNALRDGLISVATIQTALTTTKGDLFLTAAYLGVTARELDGYIRRSDEIKAFIAAIAVVKKDDQYARMSADQFGEELENITRAYRLEAVNVIHELATMPFDNAAMAEVKLKAAIQLRGADTVVSGNNDHAQVLSELNNLYRESAPRIKSIRIAQIEMES